jgi:hypothetical protein
MTKRMKVSDPEYKVVTDVIDKLTHFEMGRIMRFAPSNHDFIKMPVFTYFQARFIRLGGWTPEISKQVGWEE